MSGAGTRTDDWLLYADVHELPQELLPGYAFEGTGAKYGWPKGMFGEKSFHGLADMGIHTTSQLLRIVDEQYKPEQVLLSCFIISRLCCARALQK